MLTKPDRIIGRLDEWRDLTSFATSNNPAPTLAVVYGRRRTGKSFLLRHLTDALDNDGLFHVGFEEDRPLALRRIERALADRLGVSPRVDSWDDALAAIAELARRSTTPLTLVLDEFPYLERSSPELPSVLQHFIDTHQHGVGAPPTPLRIILCGSSLSIMSNLLSGQQPLRGRARLEMRLEPFLLGDTARLWGIDDPVLAAHLYAIVGGTPGYQPLAGASPTSLDDLGAWAADTVLHPVHALGHELDYLLREDPRITDRALYQSILSAIVSGNHTPSTIGGLLGRDARAMSEPLKVLIDGGFIIKRVDAFSTRKPIYDVADPIVRFLHAIARPNASAIAARQGHQIWHANHDRFRSNVLGPSWERLVNRWMRSAAGRSELPIDYGELTHTVVSNRRSRSSIELDLVGLLPGESAGKAHRTVTLLGEAKATTRVSFGAITQRLEAAKMTLGELGHDTSAARLVLASLHPADVTVPPDTADALLIDAHTMMST